ncbi:hypothetical protein [Streptomyces sp. NPDC018833]|uniref:hypothetical protein n=1 Tax=Streptomyces sp. NPDC018833 TaxID=3365053 RepID=UPI0037B1FD45
MSDYRSEVAALAMDGWLRQELGLPDVGISAEFDKAADSVKFDWGTVGPFADDFLPR